MGGPGKPINPAGCCTTALAVSDNDRLVIASAMELERLRAGSGSAQKPHQVGLPAAPQVGLSWAPPSVGTQVEGWMQVWADWAASGERHTRLPQRQAEPGPPRGGNPGFAVRVSACLEKAGLCTRTIFLVCAQNTVIQYSIAFCSKRTCLPPRT